MANLHIYPQRMHKTAGTIATLDSFVLYVDVFLFYQSSDIVFLTSFLFPQSVLHLYLDFVSPMNCNPSYYVNLQPNLVVLALWLLSAFVPTRSPSQRSTFLIDNLIWQLTVFTPRRIVLTAAIFHVHFDNRCTFSQHQTWFFEFLLHVKGKVKNYIKRKQHNMLKWTESLHQANNSFSHHNEMADEETAGWLQQLLISS